MSARFEVVTSASEQHFARFIAANGKEVWRTSETYKRRQGAENAACCLAGQFIIRPARDRHVFAAFIRMAGQDLEVRYIDDRLKPTPRPALPDPGSLSA